MTQYTTVQYDSTITDIGVISDTHIPARGHHLPPRIYQVFEGVQLILHAGDLVDDKIIDDLKALAPLEAVAGNMDPGHLKNSLGKLKVIRIGEADIGLMHGDLVGRRIDYEKVLGLFSPESLNAVVFGHLHEPVARTYSGILFFNPGSAVDPRRPAEPSCGRLTVSGSAVEGEIIYL